MKSDKWTPENLSKVQERALASDDFADLERFGDFGSYRRVLLGDDIGKSMLAYHNSLNPGAKVNFCHRLLNRNSNQVASILDVGCGMGYTANELTRLYKFARVLAVDISADAVEYGRKSFPKVEFFCQPIEPEGPQIGEFDIIFAFEFYPFTRTSDKNVHLQYLGYLLSQLALGGQLVIHLLWEQRESIFSSILDVEKELPEFKFSVHRVPSEKILRVVKIGFFSKLCDVVLRFLLRKPAHKAIVISRI